MIAAAMTGRTVRISSVVPRSTAETRVRVGCPLCPDGPGTLSSTATTGPERFWFSLYAYEPVCGPYNRLYRTRQHSALVQNTLTTGRCARVWTLITRSLSPPLRRLPSPSARAPRPMHNARSLVHFGAGRLRARIRNTAVRVQRLSAATRQTVINRSTKRLVHPRPILKIIHAAAPPPPDVFIIILS